jgi:hypothetical protein
MATKQKPTLAQYETWTPGQKSAWQNLGAFIHQLHADGKLGKKPCQPRP